MRRGLFSNLSSSLTLTPQWKGGGGGSDGKQLYLNFVSEDLVNIYCVLYVLWNKCEDRKVLCEQASTRPWDGHIHKLHHYKPDSLKTKSISSHVSVLSVSLISVQSNTPEQTHHVTLHTHWACGRQWKPGTRTNEGQRTSSWTEEQMDCERLKSSEGFSFSIELRLVRTNQRGIIVLDHVDAAREFSN